MKSIIQEGSSIFKALERAWQAAGKPKEFSVKVFEYPEKNFFGLTTKPAKVGIFYQEYIKETKPRQRPEHRSIKRQEPRKKEEKKQEIVQKEKVQVWGDDMITFARNWLDQALKLMNKQSVQFSVDANNYYLRFAFQQPIIEDQEKERQLFRSFSFLMLQALKRELRRPLRGFKIVLTRES